MTRIISAFLFSAVLSAVAASARADAPGSDEGRDAAMAATEHAAQMAQPVPAGRAGAPVAARDMSPMQPHTGC